MTRDNVLSANWECRGVEFEVCSNTSVILTKAEGKKRRNEGRMGPNKAIREV
jgi:hypothetical protein